MEKGLATQHFGLLRVKRVHRSSLALNLFISTHLVVANQLFQLKPTSSSPSEHNRSLPPPSGFPDIVPLHFDAMDLLLTSISSQSHHLLCSSVQVPLIFFNQHKCAAMDMHSTPSLMKIITASLFITWFSKHCVTSVWFRRVFHLPFTRLRSQFPISSRIQSYQNPQGTEEGVFGFVKTDSTPGK
ncbi:hypothetical protein RYX36_021030 [Vicia faba]